MAKKDFSKTLEENYNPTTNPVEAYLGKVPGKEVVAEQEEIQAPKRETKSKRLNLLIKPSVSEKLKKESANRNVSVNDLINQIVEQWLEKEGK